MLREGASMLIYSSLLQDETPSFKKGLAMYLSCIPKLVDQVVGPIGTQCAGSGALAGFH